MRASKFLFKQAPPKPKPTQAATPVTSYTPSPKTVNGYLMAKNEDDWGEMDTVRTLYCEFCQTLMVTRKVAHNSFRCLCPSCEFGGPKRSVRVAAERAIRRLLNLEDHPEE